MSDEIVTPPEQDWGAMSLPNWMEVLNRIIRDDDQDHNARELAKISRWLIERHHHDHATGQFLNRKAAELMNRAEQ